MPDTSEAAIVRGSVVASLVERRGPRYRACPRVAMLLSWSVKGLGFRV